MATKDYAANVESAVRPLLSGGERLLAASPLVKDPGSTEDVSLSDEAKNLLDPTILLGLGSHPGNLAQRAVFGRAVTGAAGSIGRRVFAAVEGVTSPQVAVTDQRLLIVHLRAVPRGDSRWQRWFGPVDMVASQVQSLSRDRILGAVAAPAGLFRQGRFLVGFVDGSGCVLVCAPPSLAASVIAAIGAPRQDSAGEGHG